MFSKFFSSLPVSTFSKELLLCCILSSRCFKILHKNFVYLYFIQSLTYYIFLEPAYRKEKFIKYDVLEFVYLCFVG
jgi:hypothetical protein